ncbi:hypothetical protein [Actinoplanes rectilineatus]|uniref:hypothetical protein n=1 Tax=Actinoplanes rectilineatus TaxID=113571 RepID=UPI0005F2FB5E
MDIFAVNNFGDTRSGGLAGPMGLFVILLMCIGTVLLIRNMNKRLRRLPDSFPTQAEQDRVAEIARRDADPATAGLPAGADVEANRSPAGASAEDAEVAAVPQQKKDAAAGDAADRA